MRTPAAVRGCYSSNRASIVVIRNSLIILILAALVGCTSPPNAQLGPFTTDGCSLFPNGTRDNETQWLRCCTAHDIAYWQGGTREERRAADLALRECVSATGETTIANLMLFGVWLGGSPYLPTSFRWGYGWPYSRGYEGLDGGEREMVVELLEAYRRSR